MNKVMETVYSDSLLIGSADRSGIFYYFKKTKADDEDDFDDDRTDDMFEE